MEPADETKELIRTSARDSFDRARERIGDMRTLDAVGRRDLRKQMATEGWLGMFAPERLGGGEAGIAELAIVAEEAGRALLPVPFLETGVLAPLILRDSPAASKIMPQVIADGASCAVVTSVAGPSPDAEEAIVARAKAGSWVLDGDANLVPEVADADVTMVVAANREEWIVCLVDAATRGFECRSLRATDQTRTVGSVHLEAVGVRPEQVIARGATAAHLRAKINLVGALHLAADSIGIARAALLQGIEYARTRHQFGKPIGSFQAVAHPLAALWVDVDHVAALLPEAVQELAGASERRSVAVSNVKALASKVAIRAVRQSIQTHGGVGYTWEAGLHAYLKRALLNEQLFGSSDWHARRVFEDAVASRGHFTQAAAP